MDPLDPDLQRRLDAALRYALVRRGLEAAFAGEGPQKAAFASLLSFLDEIGGVGMGPALRLQQDADAGAPFSAEAFAQLDRAVMQGLRRAPPERPGPDRVASPRDSDVRIAALKAALADLPARIQRLSASLDDLRRMEAEAALKREAAVPFCIAGDAAGRREALRAAKERLRQSLLDAPHSPLSDQRRALLAAWPED